MKDSDPRQLETNTVKLKISWIYHLDSISKSQCMERASERAQKTPWEDEIESENPEGKSTKCWVP